MQGNRIPVAEAICEKLPGAIVEHKCGAPFTVRSEVDGKKSATECLPLYALVPACCFSRRLCKTAIQKTADYAVAASMAGGPPPTERMAR